MPTYFYTASSVAGEKISGTETARDEKELAQILHQKGYVLTFVQEENAKRTFHIKKFFQGLRGVSLSEKLVFTRNLTVMVSAGISLPRALDVLAAQTKNKGFQRVLSQMKEGVTKGQMLSEAMSSHTNVFSELFVNMVKSGEEGGTLEEVLNHLTLQMERSYEIRSRVRGALIYPALVMSAMVVIGIFMLTFVVPRLAETFEDLGVELPLTTKVVIALGDFFSKRWYIVLLGFVVLLVALLRVIKTKKGKEIFDAISLRLPVLGGIIQKMNAALMTRTLSSLLAAGVPIVNSLEVTAQVLGNFYFRASLVQAAQQVQKGTKLSQILKGYQRIYPIMITQMVEVGEETGETTEILKKMAEFFEEEVNTITKNLTSIIEPILMLVIGVAVGFFAVSMFQPMYSMLQSIQ